jgi:ribosomal protein L29
MDEQPADIRETAAELDDLRRRLALARSDEEAEIEQTRSDLARIGANLRRFARRPWVTLERPASGDD